MKRQIAIFTVAWLLIALLGLLYLPRMVANVAAYLPDEVDVLGTTFTLQPIGQPLSPAELQQAQRVVENRLEQLNLTGKYKIVARPEEDQLQVTLPDNNETPRIISVITHVGEVAFVDGGLESPPLGEQLVLSADPSEQLPQVEPLFTGNDISTVIGPNTDAGDLFYQIQLKPAAAGRFNVSAGGYVCLALDSVVTNCSKMYHWSNGTLEILPDLGEAGLSLSDVGIFLESGPLPAPFEVVN